MRSKSRRDFRISSGVSEAKNRLKKLLNKAPIQILLAYLGSCFLGGVILAGMIAAYWPHNLIKPMTIGDRISLGLAMIKLILVAPFYGLLALAIPFLGGSLVIMRWIKEGHIYLSFLDILTLLIPVLCLLGLVIVHKQLEKIAVRVALFGALFLLWEYCGFTLLASMG